jgi:hypothetical protein
MACAISCRFYITQSHGLVREPLVWFDETIVAHVLAAGVRVVVVGAHCTPVLVGTAYLESTNTRLPNVVGGTVTGDYHRQHPVDPLPSHYSQHPIDFVAAPVVFGRTHI